MHLQLTTWQLSLSLRFVLCVTVKAVYTTITKLNIQKLFEVYRKLKASYSSTTIPQVAKWLSTNSANSAFCETLQDHSLLQVNPSPTRNENILDLIITDAPDRIMNIATMTPIQASLATDHDLLEFDFVARSRREKKPARYAYNFKSGEFENLKLQIMRSSAVSNSVSCNSGVDAAGLIGNRPFWILLTLISLRLESGTQNDATVDWQGSSTFAEGERIR